MQANNGSRNYEDNFIALVTLSTLAAFCQQNAVLLKLNEIQCRRRRHLLLSLIERSLTRRRRRRRDFSQQFWVGPGRVKTWWENFMNDTVVANNCRENFRMSKKSFLILCNVLCCTCWRVFLSMT